MNEAEIAHALETLKEIGQLEKTAWGEGRTAGVELQEGTTTTLPPNSRFGFVKNGTYLSPSEVDNDIIHNKPLYDIPLNSNDTWIVGGTDRNAYVPGFETEVGIAFELSDKPSGNNLLPDNVDLLELGYATLYDQSLTNVPHESFNYNKEGLVLHIETTGNKDKADLRNYKDGTPVTKLSRSEWKTDPFTSDKYNWNPHKFAVLRIKFDLYGGGDATFFLRIRNKNKTADLVELGTIAVESDPLLRVYNHMMQMRIEASGSVNGSPTASSGPLEFHNRFSGGARARNKSAKYRTININDSTGDNTWTVIRLYRVDIPKREATTKSTGLHLENSGQNANVMLRKVHKSNLTFNTFDPDDDSNWIAAPPTSTKRETSLEQADVSSDTIDIDTFTDDDDETKIHGHTELSTAVVSGGNRTTTRDTEGESPLNELEYLVLLGQISDTTKDIDLIEPRWSQRW